MEAAGAKIAQMRSEGRRKSFWLCAREHGSYSIRELIAGSYGFFIPGFIFDSLISFDSIFGRSCDSIILVSLFVYSKFSFFSFWSGTGAGTRLVGMKELGNPGALTDLTLLEVYDVRVLFISLTLIRGNGCLACGKKAVGRVGI